MFRKHLPCQRGRILYIYVCWPNTFHSRKDSNLSQHVFTKTPPMSANTQKAFEYELNKPLIYLARTKNASHQVLTKPLPCQQGYTIYLNLCWPNPSYVSEDTKYISTCVDQINPVPEEEKKCILAWIEKMDKKCISKCVDQTPHMPAMRLYIYINLRRHNLPHASYYTKCSSTWINQTHPMSSMSQYVSQVVFTETLWCQRRQ